MPSTKRTPLQRPGIRYVAAATPSKPLAPDAILPLSQGRLCFIERSGALERRLVKIDLSFKLPPTSPAASQVGRYRGR